MGGSGTTTDHGRPPGDISCEDLSFHTILSSPKLSNIAQLVANDVLVLSLSQKDGADIIVATTQSGMIAGYVSSPMQSRLAKCMKEGHQYVAVIEEIDAALCRIFIRHA